MIQIYELDRIVIYFCGVVCVIEDMVHQLMKGKKMNSLVCNQSFGYRSQTHTIRFKKI